VELFGPQSAREVNCPLGQAKAAAPPRREYDALVSSAAPIRSDSLPSLPGPIPSTLDARPSADSQFGAAISSKRKPTPTKARSGSTRIDYQPFLQ